MFEEAIHAIYRILSKISKAIEGFNYALLPPYARRRRRGGSDLFQNVFKLFKVAKLADMN